MARRDAMTTTYRSIGGMTPPLAKETQSEEPTKPVLVIRPGNKDKRDQVRVVNKPLSDSKK